MSKFNHRASVEIDIESKEKVFVDIEDNDIVLSLLLTVGRIREEGNDVFEKLNVRELSVEDCEISGASGGIGFTPMPGDEVHLIRFKKDQSCGKTSKIKSPSIDQISPDDKIWRKITVRDMIEEVFKRGWTTVNTVVIIINRRYGKSVSNQSVRNFIHNNTKSLKKRKEGRSYEYTSKKVQS